MAEKKQIGTRLPDHLTALIATRAKLLQVSQSEFLALLVQWWAAHGAPAVNDYENHILTGATKPLGARRKQPARPSSTKIL